MRRRRRGRPPDVIGGFPPEPGGRGRRDPDIKAVTTSTGGTNELKVPACLAPDVLTARPKPFFGYSDITNLHLFLWNLGLVSYLGSVMVQFVGLARTAGDFGHTDPQHVVPAAAPAPSTARPRRSM